MAPWLLPAIIMAMSGYKAYADQKKEKKEKKEAKNKYADELLYSPWLDIQPQEDQYFRADPAGTMLQGAMAAGLTYQQGKTAEATENLQTDPEVVSNRQSLSADPGTKWALSEGAGNPNSPVWSQSTPQLEFANIMPNWGDMTPEERYRLANGLTQQANPQYGPEVISNYARPR